MELCTLLLLSEQPISFSSFAAKATVAIRDADVNLVSDAHVEVSRGEDFTTIQASPDALDDHEDDELKRNRIDRARVHAYTLACTEVALLREVMGILAPQITTGWMEDDNAEVTPLAKFQKRLATARGFEDL